MKIPDSLPIVVCAAAFGLLLLAGCENSTESSFIPADVCEVHLQAWFSSTPVYVTVDERKVFSGTVTTGDIIGVAAIIPLRVAKGPHSLRIGVAGSAKDTTFTVEDTLYIGVHYDSTIPEIMCVFRRRPFMYD